ncbi:outer membrane protein assembly factor BamE [Methylosinus sp. Sm6]|uniref:outer membrane protein assembly factor BamE n=1 Tax=Methylosinus sp. Sm6 TaxID=2866948 RepID=UPI001C991B5F|nr:outer membrane protein assembly factor BamE [Methylosinus sp. Sm6]MBY6242006.1 outer membrane protein assembly factor BamE [Methylosinus sp. Sm6]
MASENSRVVLSTRARRAAAIGAVAACAATLAGCLGYDGVINRGAVIEERKVVQVKVGMPAPQVLALLGTPSTTSTIGGDAWYYVSQRLERELAFMPQEVADQRIFAVYFDKSKKVQRVADYGLQDGKIVDFLTRTTPTAGAEFQFLRNMFAKLLSF